MSYQDKIRFINARAKAFVQLEEQMSIGNYKIHTENEITRVKRELRSLPFTFTKEKYQFQMYSKDKMLKMKISSPDIADTLAMITLIPDNYIHNGSDEDIDLNEDDRDINYNEDEINEDEIIEFE